MGSLPSDPCALVSPTPFNEQQHEVMITRGFKISETEVTQGDFKAQLGYNPSHNVSCGDSCPVENVTWSQAAEYCNALSSKAGLTPCYTCTGHGTTASCEEASGYQGIAVYQCPGYRLPTEAEWEYAYHAGTKTPLYNGTITNCGIGATDPTAAVDPNAELIAWYLGNANSKSHPVKQKQANGWGLYDMAGNVREWCHDWYTENLPATAETDPISAGVGERRNLRGGYYNQTARTLRGAFRYHFDPAVTDLTIGFRCVVKL
jgi:formylglycine-generating enzyme required for sulfatase activity